MWQSHRGEREGSKEHRKRTSRGCSSHHRALEPGAGDREPEHPGHDGTADEEEPKGEIQVSQAVRMRTVVPKVGRDHR